MACENRVAYVKKRIEIAMIIIYKIDNFCVDTIPDISFWIACARTRQKDEEKIR